MANRRVSEILQTSLNIQNDQAFKQDIYYLAQKVFSLSLEDLLTTKIEVDDSIFTSYLDRYLKGEPLYYILHEAPFYSRNFYVDNRVLIPRNETEELVYYVIKEAKERNQVDIIDIGSGSGCIAITLDLELDNASLTSVDISLDALEVAKKNNQLLGSKVSFFQSDCLEEVKKRNLKFDFLVSNPPYIDEDNFVEQSVLDYEPHLALFAENKGLAIYERIFKELDSILYRDGRAFFEISPEQVEDLTKLVNHYLPGYKYEFIKDINSFTRFLLLKKPL